MIRSQGPEHRFPASLRWSDTSGHVCRVTATLHTQRTALAPVDTEARWRCRVSATDVTSGISGSINLELGRTIWA